MSTSLMHPEPQLQIGLIEVLIGSSSAAAVRNPHLPGGEFSWFQSQERH